MLTIECDCGKALKIDDDDVSKESERVPYKLRFCFSVLCWPLKRSASRPAVGKQSSEWRSVRTTMSTAPCQSERHDGQRGDLVPDAWSRYLVRNLRSWTSPAATRVESAYSQEPDLFGPSVSEGRRGPVLLPRVVGRVTG